MRLKILVVATFAAIAAVPVSIVVTTSVTTSAAACSLHGYKHGFCSLEKYIQDNPAEAKASGLAGGTKAPDDAGKKPKVKDKK